METDCQNLQRNILNSYNNCLIITLVKKKLSTNMEDIKKDPNQTSRELQYLR